MSISTHLHKLGEYNKSVVAGLGSVLMVATSLLAFGNFLPEGVAGWLAVVLGLGTSASVYLVKNQDSLDQLGDSAADIFDR